MTSGTPTTPPPAEACTAPSSSGRSPQPPNITTFQKFQFCRLAGASECVLAGLFIVKNSPKAGPLEPLIDPTPRSGRRLMTSSAAAGMSSYQQFADLTRKYDKFKQTEQQTGARTARKCAQTRRHSSKCAHAHGMFPHTEQSISKYQGLL